MLTPTDGPGPDKELKNMVEKRAMLLGPCAVDKITQPALPAMFCADDSTSFDFCLLVCVI